MTRKVVRTVNPSDELKDETTLCCGHPNRWLALLRDGETGSATSSAKAKSSATGNASNAKKKPELNDE